MLDVAAGRMPRWLVPVSVGAVAVVALVAYLALAGQTDSSATPAESSAARNMGTAVLESVPAGSDVFIDGAPAGTAPVSRELAPGRHIVEFRWRNSSRKLNVEVVAGQSVTERLDWAAKRNGSLEVLTDPYGLPVTVDGVPRGVTPLTIDDLELGLHTVVLDGSRGPVSHTVGIEADRPAQIIASARSGWLHVSSPVELRITEGTRGLTLDERSQIRLSSGVYDLRFESPQNGYRERRRVEIKAGAITSLSIVPSSAFSVRASLPSVVSIDGARVGETPLVNYPMGLGDRSVVVRSLTGAERHFTIQATAKPTSLDVDFSKP